MVVEIAAICTKVHEGVHRFAGVRRCEDKKCPGYRYVDREANAEIDPES